MFLLLKNLVLIFNIMFLLLLLKKIDWIIDLSNLNSWYKEFFMLEKN